MRLNRGFPGKLALLVALSIIIIGVIPAEVPQISLAQSGNGSAHQLPREKIIAHRMDSTRNAAPHPVFDIELLRQEYLKRREAIASRVNNHPVSSDPGLPEPFVPETRVTTTADAAAGTLGMSHPSDDPSALVLGRNNKNTEASSIGSSVADAVAVSAGSDVFYAGLAKDPNNGVYASYSIDGGSSWTSVNIPVGPPDAPIPFTDPDVVYMATSNVTIWSVLYVNGALNNGVVRIFVRHAISSTDDCYYDVDPAGAADNIVPDYPHLSISDNYLYLATNNVNLGTSTWLGAQMRRFSLNQMAGCQDISPEVFSYTGSPDQQRIFVPVEGAKKTMYWGMLETATTFRVFTWTDDNSPVPTSVTQSIAASTFTNPDCRGGVGDYDFINAPYVLINGQSLRGAVGGGKITFFWNAGSDTAHPQGYVRGAVFQESNLSVIDQPIIWNNDFCYGFPDVSVNDQGDLGLTIAAGGKAGGGSDSFAAQGYVGIHDAFSTGSDYFGTLSLTARGTHNRSDGRYGEYFSIHPKETPCGLFFVATNYALLNGNTLSSNVNARYIEFGRGRDYACYLGSSAKLLPLYSWYSPSQGDNFATADPSWAGKLGDIRSPGYGFVRIEGQVFNPALPQPEGTVPLYSWYSPSRGDHFLTTDPVWAGSPGDTRPPDYSFGRLEGYIYEMEHEGGLPLYSWYSPSRGDNFATANPLLGHNIGDSWPPDYTLYRIEGYLSASLDVSLYMPLCVR